MVRFQNGIIITKISHLYIPKCVMYFDGIITDFNIIQLDIYVKNNIIWSNKVCDCGSNKTSDRKEVKHGSFRINV